ncbi:M30 family zinc metallopeptidase [Cupriavidus pauculus]|uniref:M30 family zinc metallopeptidase n=1 Tax=Cupriavidus pauculus TaxID=82633 RepID=UPI0007840FCE|nr:hypothetical protein [Cupriavidus pauculus]
MSPTSSLYEQLRRFAATSGALMKAPSPTGFGFPARAEGGFTLPVIDPQVDGGQAHANAGGAGDAPAVRQPAGGSGPGAWLPSARVKQMTESNR